MNPSPIGKMLEVNSLCKSFSNVQAVKNINFNIKQGDIFAFLGPNGAGKTTTIRILLDIIKADKGDINWTINGNNMALPAAKYIGYLPEERGLYPDIPVIKSLVYLASIRGMDPKKARSRAMEWLKRTGLADRAKDKLQTLSKGNQQKIQFIASVLHQPQFLILDEPFSGLDPLNQEIFIEYIKEINEQGTTILLSAHQMALVEKVAHKIFLINNGQEIFKGSLNSLYDYFGQQHIIKLRFSEPISLDINHMPNEIEGIQQADEFNVQLNLKSGSSLNKALAELAKLKGINDITSHRPDLHEIFIQLVKRHSK
ncbi:MAG TPA: ATP-binding cassette domain-containing protein [Bacteroidales bacterium]|nr:ATP-binding cassette domain-containing protein [Bacteroidales bacterium]